MYIPDSKGLFFLTASAAQVYSVAADGRLVRGLAELTLINFKGRSMNLKKYLPYVGVLALGGVLVFALVYKHNADLAQIRASYITEKAQDTEIVAQRVERAFREFYQG